MSTYVILWFDLTVKSVKKSVFVLVNNVKQLVVP